MQNNSKTQVTTGLVRLSYAYLFEPRKNDDGSEKYSVSLLIPKSDVKTIADINAAIEAAIESGKEKLGKTPRASLKLPLRDGEETGKEEYVGMYFINANNTRKPTVVDAKVNPILNPEEVYSGCWAKVCVNFFAFNSKTNKGIGCSLQAVQKIKDDECLGGGIVDASAVFTAEEEDDDPFS